MASAATVMVGARIFNLRVPDAPQEASGNEHPERVSVAAGGATARKYNENQISESWMPSSKRVHGGDLR
jgi:hypothetical protein